MTVPLTQQLPVRDEFGLSMGNAERLVKREKDKEQQEGLIRHDTGKDDCDPRERRAGGA